MTEKSPEQRIAESQDLHELAETLKQILAERLGHEFISLREQDEANKRFRHFHKANPELAKQQRESADEIDEILQTS